MPRPLPPNVMAITGGDEEALRDHILRAAHQVITERGLAAASIRVIAEQAGVSAGTLYNYFDDHPRLPPRPPPPPPPPPGAPPPPAAPPAAGRSGSSPTRSPPDHRPTHHPAKGSHDMFPIAAATAVVAVLLLLAIAYRVLRMAHSQ